MGIWKRTLQLYGGTRSGRIPGVRRNSNSRDGRFSATGLSVVCAALLLVLPEMSAGVALVPGTASAASSSSCAPVLFSAASPWKCTSGKIHPHVATAGSGLPEGFTDTIVWSGLNAPTAIRFASDGRVFVAEKSGIILIFDSLSSTTP